MAWDIICIFLRHRMYTVYSTCWGYVFTCGIKVRNHIKARCQYSRLVKFQSKLLLGIQLLSSTAWFLTISYKQKKLDEEQTKEINSLGELSRSLGVEWQANLPCTSKARNGKDHVFHEATFLHQPSLFHRW